MAKKPVTFKNNKAPKKNALEGISTVKAATQSGIRKEEAKGKKLLETGSLEQDFIDFEQLLKTRGWQKLVFVNSENARLLGEQILKKQDLAGSVLDEVACDRLRDQRDAILEMIEFPNKVIAQYQAAHEPVPDDETDPYETSEQASAREPKHLENDRE